MSKKRIHACQSFLPELEDNVEDISGEPRQEEGDADQQNHHVRPLPPPLRLGMTTLEGDVS